ncbi:hypothetical protein LUCX_83 [Xanthomonas phage vB_XciM_LucasX]|nr:hypothetical protein LUCX_83 [Xanthomonas phage vB_XciM_LucasX]
MNECSNVVELDPNRGASSRKILEGINRLPPMSGPINGRKMIHFQLIGEPYRGSFLTLEEWVDGTADVPGEGISQFGKYFNHGTITPDGEVLVAHQIFHWRMSAHSYYGGDFITSLGSEGMRNVNNAMSRELWGSCVASIADDRIRASACRKLAVEGVAEGRSYRDFVLAMHEIHRKEYTPDYHNPRILFL